MEGGHGADRGYYVQEMKSITLTRGTKPSRPPAIIPARREEGVMKVLLAHDAIQARVLEMGKDIARDYAGREPHLVCVLKGACTFMTDLSRAIDLSLTLDYIAV